MRQGVRTAFSVVWLFLLVQFVLVQCFGPASPALAQTATCEVRQRKKAASRLRRRRSRSATAPSGCRARSQDMREAILSAVRSGRIEELRHAWELNELKPDLGVAPAGRRSDRAMEADLG